MSSAHMCRFQFLPKVFMLFYYFCNGEILSHRFRKSQYEIMHFFFHGFLLLFPDTAGKYHFLFLIAIHIHKHKIINCKWCCQSPVMPVILIPIKFLTAFICTDKPQTGLSFRTVPEEKKSPQKDFPCISLCF